MPYSKANREKDLACKRRYNHRYYAANGHLERQRQARTRQTEHGKELHRAQERRSRLRNPPRALWIAAKQRAKKKNIPFSIDVEDIIIPTICPVLGIPLVFRVGQKYFQPDSPSLDRIVTSLGYVKGNVAVISWRANRLKTDATLEEMEAITRWMREKLCQST